MVERRGVLHFGLGAALAAPHGPAFVDTALAQDGNAPTPKSGINEGLISQSELATVEGASRVGIAGGGTVQSAIAVARSPAALLSSSTHLAEGSTIRTADGFVYEVAPPSASDHDLATAGGMKLYYQPGTGAVNALAFGSRGDGISDDTVALQAALDFAGKNNGGIRSVYLPASAYRTRTLYLPLGVRLFGDGGSSESTINNASKLVQIGGGDVIRFKAYSARARHYWWGEIDHLSIWGDNTQRGGWGINFRDAAGNAVIPQDSNFLHHLTIRRCYEGGINVPSGAFPMCIADCKLLFNNGPGIKLTRTTTFQSIHFLNISGDGNNGGVISLNGLNEGGDSVLITNLKSEARANFDYGVECQQNAIVATRCDGCPIVIHGATHTSSIPDGRVYRKPGNLIQIGAGGTPPDIRWSGVTIRVRTTDTGADPAVIGGAVSPNPIRATYRHSSGSFNGSHRLFNASLALSWSNARDGDKTPSVVGQNALLLSNSSPTSITAFVDALEGQVLHVIAEDENTTLVNGAALRLAGRLDFTMAKNDSCSLIYVSGAWRELGRSTER